jgi:hypothetical protein
MDLMSQASFTSSFCIDHLDEWELDSPAEFDDYRAWIEASLVTFPTMTCASICSLRVVNEVRCDLYCALHKANGEDVEDDIEDATIELIFGVRSQPGEGSFKFNGLNLEFFGEEERVYIGDSLYGPG